MSKKSKTNGGCFLACLKGMGILCILGVLLAFGWIAGVIWLLFFRKKLKDDPGKQKKQTIIVSSLSALSLIFFIFGMGSDATSEETSNTLPTQIVTETTEGPMDTESIETPLAITSPTPTPTVKPTAVPTPEPTATPTPTPTPTPEPTASPTPEPIRTPEPTVQTIAKPTPSAQSSSSGSSAKVWVDDTAKRYHKSSTSCGMDNPYQVTVEEAERMGKTPCGRCY